MKHLITLSPIILSGSFIGLKLTGVISWSWWWVVSPFWITLAALLLYMAVISGIIIYVFIKGDQADKEKVDELLSIGTYDPESVLSPNSSFESKDRKNERLKRFNEDKLK